MWRHNAMISAQDAVMHVESCFRGVWSPEGVDLQTKKHDRAGQCDQLVLNARYLKTKSTNSNRLGIDIIMMKLYY